MNNDFVKNFSKSRLYRVLLVQLIRARSDTMSGKEKQNRQTTEKHVYKFTKLEMITNRKLSKSFYALFLILSINARSVQNV